MGNISNPSINRWGLNLFWYRYWYSDIKNQSNIQQDYIFNNLVCTYVLYGILHPQHLFLSRRWYLLTPEFFNDYKKDYMKKYYRDMEMKTLMENETVTHCLREKRKNLHLSKLWIFRYQSWIIINLYSFQPVRTFLLDKPVASQSINDFSYQISKTNTGFRRLKFFFYNFLLKLKLKNTNNYWF